MSASFRLKAAQPAVQDPQPYAPRRTPADTEMQGLMSLGALDCRRLAGVSMTLNKNGVITQNHGVIDPNLKGHGHSR